MLYKVKTESGSEYVIDLENRVLLKNNQKIEIESRMVTVLSEEQFNDIATRFNQIAMGLDLKFEDVFDYEKYSPAISNGAAYVAFKKPNRHIIDTSTRIMSVERYGK